jgi:hypothetical protein
MPQYSIRDRSAASVAVEGKSRPKALAPWRKHLTHAHFFTGFLFAFPRMHRNRSGSSLGAGASSFDPSDYGEDSSDDEDGEGRVRRNRSFKAMSTR